jgi:hypothetical protein
MGLFGSWEHGRATIVAKQRHEGMYKLVQANNVHRSTFDYVADVVPDDGGGTFRATFTETFTGGDGALDPSPGEEVPVLSAGAETRSSSSATASAQPRRQPETRNERASKRQPEANRGRSRRPSPR